MATAVGWRWVFGGLLPLPLIAAALVLPALRALPSAPDAPQKSGSVWYALQLSAGVGCLLHGLGDFGQRHLAWALPLILVGAVLAVRALWQLMPAGTLRAAPGQPAAIASMALITFVFFGSEAFVPLALSYVRGVSVAYSGLPLTAAALSWTAGAWLPVKVAGRVSRRTLVLLGLSVLAVGIAGTTAVLVPSVPPASILVSWSIAGLGMGIAFTTTSAAVLDGVGSSGSAKSSAALQLAQALGASLATGIGGAIVAAPFAGDPPRFGIMLVDMLMLIVLVAIAATARGIRGSA